MAIRNQTKQTLLSHDGTELQSFYQKSLGLLGSKHPTAVIFTTRFGIHTFGMTYPIDVLILDEYHSVVALKHSLRPNKIFFWNPRYQTVLELPAGTVKKTKTNIGDQLLLADQ